MATWSKDELNKIAEADDLHISPFREDGLEYGTRTWIWSVAVDDALYVRAYNGQDSRWYHAALHQKAGADHRSRYRKRSSLRAGQRADQRPHRRRLPCQVPGQPVSKLDDQCTRPLGDDQDHSARERIDEFRDGYPNELVRSLPRKTFGVVHCEWVSIRFSRPLIRRWFKVLA